MIGWAIIVIVVLAVIAVIIAAVSEAAAEDRREWRTVYPDGKETYRLRKADAISLRNIFGGRVVFSPYREWWGERDEPAESVPSPTKDGE